MSARIKVLIVDDSVVIRKGLKLLLQSDPDLEVIGEARNGEEALKQIALLHPDIVTMDIEMPVMDGLTALRRIMASDPLPVIVFSTLSTEGADVTMDALEAGAVDFLPKDVGNLAFAGHSLQAQLIAKIKSIVYRRRTRHFSGKKKRREIDARPGRVVRGFMQSVGRKRVVQAILIGSSTGGPQVLQKIVSGLPAEFPCPIVIVQHMPKFFTASLARRLNHAGHLPVDEARDSELLEKGHILVAPGGMQLRFEREGLGVRVRIRQQAEHEIYKPSVTVAALSLAETLPGRAVGVMLTGMGQDGLEGFKKMKERNAYLIAQSEESCTIYGMPRAIVETGLADAVLSPEEIAHAMAEICVV